MQRIPSFLLILLVFSLTLETNAVSLVSDLDYVIEEVISNWEQERRRIQSTTSSSTSYSTPSNVDILTNVPVNVGQIWEYLLLSLTGILILGFLVVYLPY